MWGPAVWGEICGKWRMLESWKKEGGVGGQFVIGDFRLMIQGIVWGVRGVMAGGELAEYNGGVTLFDNWGRLVLTGQGRLAVARRGVRLVLVKPRTKT